MRGVPGSGKSFEVKKIIEEHKDVVVHSTDNYFLKNGSYCFDYNLLSLNHKLNFEAASCSMKNGVETVVIDNTNCVLSYIIGYVKVAIDNNYHVVFKEPENKIWLDTRNKLSIMRKEEELLPYAEIFAQRNIHGVSAKIILKMLMNYDCDITLDLVIQKLKDQAYDVAHDGGH